jgi:hypothetical protein
MPEVEALDEAGAAALAAAIEAGEDGIEVPAALIEEAGNAPRSEEARSLYARIIDMPVTQKIKLALRGNQDARMILIRDTNRMVRRFVLANPRISEGEIVGIARNKSADDELIRLISERRDWMRLYQVRMGLVTNPKTPLPVAIRQIATLDDRDVRQLAKSKNVPAAVAAQARRLVLSRESH